MKKVIFYGAGKYAGENLSRWAKNGLVPVCFADADKNKHGQLFRGVKIHPLDYAVSQYPDYEIYLTVGVDLLGKVTDYLMNERCIPRERISYPDAVETRKGCKLIGTQLQFFDSKFGTCCMPRTVTIPYSENFEENFEQYKFFCDELLSKLRSGEKTICDGCSRLREDIWPVEPRLEVIGFDTAFEEDKCNFNCIYCGKKKLMAAKVFKLSLADAFRKFEQISEGVHRNIVLASGEISISPYRDEVFDIIERNSWNIYVLTNASVFSQKLADLIRAGYAKIQVSMDAGTPATFAKIKGIDCWEKVVLNLQKYAENANSREQIDLKYILLPGINDNFVDIDGFIELAGQLGANVVISSDSANICAQLSEKTYECALRLGKICRKREIRFSIAAEFFYPQTYKKLTAALRHE